MKVFKYFVILFLVSPLVLAQTEMTADQIVQKQIDQNKGYASEKASAKMTIVGKNGKGIEREFDMFQLEEQGEQNYKAMIKVSAPNDLKGTGLLTHQYKDREDDQWLFLPALKKTRRIAGSAKNGRFLGSDFTYEDLSPRKKEDYTYKLLREEACGAAQCYVIESTPKDKESQYAKGISWISKDQNLAQKMELYAADGSVSKSVVFENFQQFDSFWRPLKITMKDHKKDRHTVLEFSKIQVKAGLSEGDFSKKALER